MADAILTSSGIYQIRNIVNGKVYIGSSSNIRSRFSDHRTQLMRGVHPNQKLQHSWNKHGKVSFAFEVLEIVQDFSQLIHREQNWIDSTAAHSENGYNIRKIAESNRGMVRRAESNAKQSASMKGKKMPPRTEEHKERLRASHIGMVTSEAAKIRQSLAKKGKTHNAEARLNMSNAAKGRIRSAEHCKNLSIALSGRKLSASHVAKMSIAFTGKKAGDVARANQSAAMMGRIMKPETRAKLSLANKGKIMSPESRVKMSVAAKIRHARNHESL